MSSGSLSCNTVPRHYEETRVRFLFPWRCELPLRPDFAFGAAPVRLLAKPSIRLAVDSNFLRAIAAALRSRSAREKPKISCSPNIKPSSSRTT